MRSLASCVVLTILGTVSDVHSGLAQGVPAASRADSLSLERTVCYGTCPAYRLVLTRTGRLSFVGTHPKDSTRVTNTLSVDSIKAIWWELDATRVLTFPAKIRDDATLCPDVATDHPTVILTLYLESGIHRVEDYHGCFLRSDHTFAGRLVALRSLEDMIDRRANTSRWVRFLANRYN